jgi:hypothetical protein
MIFFAHVQRTAGTSIHKYFRTAFKRPTRLAPGARHLVLSGPHELPAAAEVIRNLPDSRLYLGGHIGLHQVTEAGIPFLASDVAFATVRNPLERAVSMYYLALRSPEWMPHLAAITYRGFEYFYDFCRDLGEYFLNDHCRMLAGSDSFGSTMACVQEKFDIVGSVAHMEEFERALLEVCAREAPRLEIHSSRENAAYHRRAEPGTWQRKAEVSEHVSPGLATRIARENEADFALVEWVETAHGGVFRNSLKERL